MPPNKRMLTEEQRERKKQRERERYLNMSREQLELKRQRDRIRRRRLKMTEEQQDPKQQLELQKQLELKEQLELQEQRDRDRRWEECRQKALTWTEEELEQKREQIRAKMTAKQLKRLRRRQGARDRPRTEAHAEEQFVGERQAGDVETQEDDSSNSGDTTDAETESILVGGSSILPDLLPPDEEAEESVESDTWLLMMPDAMKTEIKTEERVDDQVDAGMDDDDDNEAPAEIEVEECCPPLQVVVGVVPSALLLVEQLVTSFMKQSIRSGTKRLSEVVPPDLQSTLDENADETFSVLDLFKTKTQMQALTGVSANVIDCLAQLMTLLLPARLEGKLSIRQRVVMTLTKLRTNMSFDVLGSLFGVDRRTCGKFFSSTIRSLALILRPCIYSPTKEENLMIQKQSETVMLLAMVEISLESTNCSECHSELYVPNNGSSFIKFYTGVVPSGLIIYLSRVHSSIVDNKKILAESDLIPMKLSQPKSDIEIVDDDDDDIQIIAESLHQKKVCEENHITMDTPNACREADLLNAKEELNNAVQKMKMFKIWSGKLSTAIAPLIDEILTVIAGLINLTSPLISGECITPVKECAC